MNANLYCKTLAALLLAAPVCAQTTTAPATTARTTVTLATALPAQPPDVAAPKLDPKTGQPQAGFLKAHEEFLALAREGTAGLVFLGDSITAGWKRQQAIWDRAFGKYQPVNFGIGGDRTQHVLWRIENGELDGIKPKAVVIMIGTNNSALDSAEAIARGITRIVETVRAKQPQAKILLLAVFPRGEKPSGRLTWQCDKLKEVNRIIARLDDGAHVFYLDIGDRFVQGAGPISAEIMPDFLHLTARGYELWAEAIAPKLAELMR